ncbi:MAG: ATP synthase subunit I [Acidimicrobiia bacterium]|nr:ATP synthase subunit I [Acidimicrobiia bacterium]
MDAPAAVTAPGAALEGRVAADMARKAALVAPPLLLGVGLLRGVDGAVGVALALALVALNLLAAARIITWSVAISPNLLMGAVLGGYALRLGALFVIVLGLERLSWVDVPALVLTLALTHLGLLFWEMRSVSLTLAYPGLRPEKE